MTLTAGKLWGLRRLADKGGRFKMTATDQRPPIKNPIKAHHGTAEAPYEEVARFKAMLVKELQGLSSAMLVDPHYTFTDALKIYDPANGLILTLEDSLFTETPDGRLSDSIDNWSVEKIKRAGGDAVKVLTWYRPDAGGEINQRQQDFTQAIGDACAKYDIPYVFELLVYPLAKDSEQTTDYVEMKTKKPELVLESVETFAAAKYGVDVFKLESPLAAADVPGIGAEGAEEAQVWFDRLHAAAGRPWVMLSAGAGMAEFRNILTHAYRAGASGYLAGRAIWADAFKKYPDWAAIEVALRGEALDYMAAINTLTDEAATPWFDHDIFGGAMTLAHEGAAFRSHYSGFGDA